ncbi:MAG: CBS domain-containing protein [Nitrosopumilales archaeon]|nr:CBS domain-containing protein [Nitrosopumilales archaeon]
MGGFQGKIMVSSNNKKSISELTLETLFSNTLTDIPCVNIDENREAWVATEMCAQYLESAIDSIVVRDGNDKPVGIIGGYDLLDNLRKNPTPDFLYQTTVKEIMFKGFPQVDKKIKLKDLIEKWQNSRMLEIGAKCKTDISVSSMPKKKVVTFQQDDHLGKILDLMFEQKTRKLLLENSNQFISDRIILEGISILLKLQKDIDHFLNMPANQFKLEHVNVITEDLKFNRLCSMMDKIEHPYVVYKDIVVSPWDVCLTLLSDNLTELGTDHQKKITCPHCGKYID